MLVNRLSSALSDRVVTVSDDAAAVAVEIERVPPGKVVTILNGVDTAAFRPSAEAAPARATEPARRWPEMPTPMPPCEDSAQ